jgi:hypothetical protein
MRGHTLGTITAPGCSGLFQAQESVLNRLVVIGILAVCAAVVISAMPAPAGQVPQGTGQATPTNATPQTGMADSCQAMMADQRAMMTEMTGADQRLDELVGNMNAASSMDKADATAAVVDEIDTQRRTLRDGVMKMQRGLRAHTVEHIQAGMDSMAMRPVMNQAGGGIR